MKTRKNLVAMFFLTLACVLFAGWSESAYAQKNGGEGSGSGGSGTTQAIVRVRLLSPTGGILFAGQTTRLTWEVDDPQKISSNTWSEQEVYLIANGRYYRLTRELGGMVRSVDVVIPNIKADTAYFEIRFGCQDNSSFVFESAQAQKEMAFSIRPRPTRDLVQEVVLEPIGQKTATPGEAVTLKWTSIGINVDTYEVLVSFDRGGNYQSLTTTADTSYSWVVPGKLKGPVTFKVVARSLDGSEIESLTEGTPHLRIK